MKNHIQQQLEMKLQDAKNGLAYCNEALNSSMELWERKEYEVVALDRIREINKIENHLLCLN